MADNGIKWLKLGLREFGLNARLQTLMGQALRGCGRQEEALGVLFEARRLDPSDLQPIIHQGLVLIDLARFDEAVAALAEVMRRAPEVAEHHRLLGIACRLAGDFTRAESALRSALGLAPKDPQAWVDLALLLEETNRPDESIRTFQQGLAEAGAQRRLVEATISALRRRGRHKDAVNWIAALLKDNPTVAWLHFQMGQTLQNHDRPAANRHFARAVELEPSDPKWLVAEAESFNRTRGPEEAANISVAYELATRRLSMGGDLLADARPLIAIFGRIGDFDAIDRLGTFEQLGRHFARTGADTALQLLLARVERPEHRRLLVEWHRSCGNRMVEAARRMPLDRPYREEAEGVPAAPAIGGKARIRVGLMSSDLRDHPVGYFVRPLIEHYDRSRFAFYGYSWYTRQPDSVQSWMAERLEGFRHRAPIADRDAAQLIADDRLDVLFDLGGSTDLNKLAVMGWHPAARTVSWLGYPHSAGLESIDRILTDPYLQPPDPALLIEKPFRLARSWVAFERTLPQEQVAIELLTPEERSGRLTFGTMNNPVKYTAGLFAVWSQILERVPGSRFLFVRPEGAVPAFRQRVEAAFARHGIDPTRISYTPVRGQHLPHYNAIDVALDTFPQTGGTTTCETLWMGVPVVSLIGEAFFERMSYSNLVNAGLGDLAVATPEAYVDKAVELAAATAWRGELRRTLRERLRSMPLGDGRGFARDFQDAITGWMDEPRP